MAVGKLNRPFSLRTFVSLLCILPFAESLGRSLSLQFNNCDPSGGTCIQCWNADAVNGDAPKEASNLVQTSCLVPGMTFEISEGTDKIYNWGRTPKGWALHDHDEFKIAVKASVGWIDSSQFSRVAVEVQLCNIDNFMICQPVIAPTTFFDDVTMIEDVQNLQTTETPSVTRFVDLDLVDSDTVEETLNFGEITALGTYRILTSLVLSDGSNATGMSMISDVKYLNVINEDPLELSSESYTAIIVLSSITSSVILFLLFQTVTNRNAQVFELTQGKFIIAMQVCALVATSSLILFTPRDPFCQLSTPLLYLSTHMVYAILLGRMWRVRAVISPLLLLTLERKDDWTTKIVDWISRFTACGCWQKKQQKKIRKQITDYQLARVVMLLILPQLFVQVLILTVYYDNKSIVDRTERIGIMEEIYICEYGAFYSILHIFSVSLIGGEFLMLALLMHGSRDLPSLFNETKKVWQILRSTFVFVLAGTLLIAATIDHDNTAQVRVLVPAFVLGLNMVQTCWVITWSKLKVAWSGHTILVTKLIADHNFNKGKSEAAGLGSSKYYSQHSYSSHHTFSGYQTSSNPQISQITTTDAENEPSASSDIILEKESRLAEQVESDDRSTDSSVFLAETQEPVVVIEDSERNHDFGISHQSDDSFSLLDNSTNSMRTADTARRKAFTPMSNLRHRKQRRFSNGSRGSTATRGSNATRGSMVVRRKYVGRGRTSSIAVAKTDNARAKRNRFSVFGNASRPSMPKTVVVESIDMNPRLSHDKIKISETEAPGRRLLLRMIDVQRMLARINTSLLTGISLDRDDWEELREGCVTLGEVFEGEVVFVWENEEESSIGSASHQTPPRRPLNYRPANRQQANSLPTKSRVAATTNVGPKRRSVTFKSDEMEKVMESDELLGTMLRQPLTPIMSIGDPIVRRAEDSESSEVDGVHEEKGVPGKIGSMPTDASEQQLPNDSNGTLPKHRVRPNPHASFPADVSIDEVPLGQFQRGSTDPLDASFVSELRSETTSEIPSTESAADVSTGQFSLGKFQKAKELTRFSGISNVSSGEGSESRHRADSMSTLGNSDSEEDLKRV